MDVKCSFMLLLISHNYTCKNGYQFCLALIGFINRKQIDDMKKDKQQTFGQ